MTIGISAQMEGYLADMARKYKVASIEDLLRYPKYFQVETVSTCNARCVMCPIEEWTRATLLMDDDLFNKIVEDMRPHASWIEMITLQGAGEPLIDKKLEARIKILKDIGIKNIVISSNGSLLSENRAIGLIEAGLDDLTVSFDGATKETYEAIRRRLSYEEVVGNVKRFIEIRNRMNAKTTLRLRMTVMDQNISEFNDFLTFWKAVQRDGDRVYGKVYNSWNNFIEGYELPPAQARELERLNASPCSSLWSSMVIFTDGRVPLCCIDYNAEDEMGNVLKNSIREVWVDKMFADYRASHAEAGREAKERCINCNAWDDTTRLETPLAANVKSLREYV